MALVVQIGANVSGAIKGIEEVSLTLKEQKVILASLQKQYASLSTQQIKSTIGKELAADIKLASSEVKRLESGSVSAFGNIGQAAGKGFSAVRQLAYILPGIGIAGIFSAAFSGIESLVSGIFKVGHAFSEAALDAEVFKKARENSLEDTTKLQALVAVAKDVSLSINERKNAVAELQKLYPDYLRNISLETINSDSARKAIDDLTNSILKKAVVEQYSKKFAEESLKQDELRTKQSKALQKDLDLAAERQNELRKGDLSVGASLEFFSSQEQAKAAVISTTKAISDQQKVLDKIFDKVKANTALSLDFTATPKGESLESQTNKVIAEGKRLAAAFGDISKIHLSVLPEFTELDTKPEQLAKAKEIITKIKNHFEKFGTAADVLKLIIPVKPEPLVVPPDEAEIVRTKDEVTEILKSLRIDPVSVDVPFAVGIQGNIDLIEKFQKQFDDLQAKIPKIDFTAPVNVNFKLITNALETAKAIDEATKSINQSIANIQIDALANIGEAIGTAFAGGDLQNVFKSFANIIGDGLESIGKQFIKIGIVAVLSKKAIEQLFANPVLAIAAGVALVAAGAALKSVIGKGIPGRAGGGPVVGGSPYIVGERGQELFIPSTSGRIVSNNNLQSIQGAANQHITVGGEVYIDGRKLKLIIARDDRFTSRNV